MALVLVESNLHPGPDLLNPNYLGQGDLRPEIRAMTRIYDSTLQRFEIFQGSHQALLGRLQKMKSTDDGRNFLFSTYFPCMLDGIANSRMGAASYDDKTITRTIGKRRIVIDKILLRLVVLNDFSNGPCGFKSVFSWDPTQKDDVLCQPIWSFGADHVKISLCILQGNIRSDFSYTRNHPFTEGIRMADELRFFEPVLCFKHSIDQRLHPPRMIEVPM